MKKKPIITMKMVTDALIDHLNNSPMADELDCFCNPEDPLADYGQLESEYNGIVKKLKEVFRELEA